jgi:leader peptidase (prepilin peptidase)/N-methyltransferase
MGFGDVVLMAMIGSFIGWQATLIVFFLAPVCALSVAGTTMLFRRHREMPYGPYLSLATLLVIVGWKWVWPVAERQIFALGPLLPVATLIMTAALAGLLWLSRWIQELLGIYPDDEQDLGDWSPGAQLAWMAGAAPDRQAGKWQSGANELWPGAHSGRGQGYGKDWRGADPPMPGQAWQSHWRRSAR